MKRITKLVGPLLALMMAGSALTAYAEELPAQTAPSTETAVAESTENEETEDIQYGEIPCGEAGWNQEMEARSELVAQCSNDSVAAYAEADSTYTELRDRVAKALETRQEQIDLSDLNLTTTQIAAFVGEPGTLAGGYKVKNGIRYSYSSWSGKVLSLILEYYSEEDCVQMAATVDKIKTRVEHGTTDLEKAMLLHNEIIASTQYDYEGTKKSTDYTAYGVLMEGVAVCDGYTKAFACIANELGIPTIRISSKALNHAWNLVMLDGNWYELDCTWDDTELSGIDYGSASYKYFMRSSSDFAEKCEHNAADVIGLYTSFDTNMAYAATDTTYDDAWWVKNSTGDGVLPTGLIQLYDGDWYFSQSGAMQWRDTLWDGSDTSNRMETAGKHLYGCSLIGNRVFGTENLRQSSVIHEYSLDSEKHTVDWVKDYPVDSYGIMAHDGKLYYASSQKSMRDLQELDIGTIEPPPTPAESPYIVQGSSVYGVSENTTPEEFLEKLNSSEALTLQNTAPNGNVGTGTQICDAKGTVVMTVVVYGDLDGNAKVDANDLVLMRRAILGMSALQGDYLKAATPISKNQTTPTSFDLTEMRRYLLKIITKLG